MQRKLKNTPSGFQIAIYLIVAFTTGISLCTAIVYLIIIATGKPIFLLYFFLVFIISFSTVITAVALIFRKDLYGSFVKKEQLIDSSPDKNDEK